MLNARIKSSALVLLSACLVLWLSHIPLVLDLAILFLSLGALKEMGQALSVPPKPWLYVIGTAEVLLLVLVPESIYGILVTVIFTAVVLMSLAYMVRFQSVQTIPMWTKWLILLSMPLFFTGMRYLRPMEEGLFILAAAIFLCMLTDSFAYMVGKKFGQHKLAPHVSPGKTVEGSLGGAAAATLLIFLFVFLMGYEANYVKLVIYLLLGSFVSQLGDLSMSIIKRMVGIKDYGNLIPGHGGILDRFDSLLFVLPYTYLFCALFGSIL